MGQPPFSVYQFDHETASSAGRPGDDQQQVDDAGDDIDDEPAPPPPAALLPPHGPRFRPVRLDPAEFLAEPARHLLRDGRLEGRRRVGERVGELVAPGPRGEVGADVCAAATAVAALVGSVPLARGLIWTTDERLELGPGGLGQLTPSNGDTLPDSVV